MPRSIAYTHRTHLNPPTHTPVATSAHFDEHVPCCLGEIMLASLSVDVRRSTIVTPGSLLATRPRSTVLALLATLATSCSVDATLSGRAIDAGNEDTPDANNNDATMQAANLIAWYPLDQVTATGTTDEAGGQDALCDADCPTTTSGFIGGAVSFSDQRLVVVDDGRFTLTNGFTIAGWARAHAIDTLGCMMTQPLRGGRHVDNVWALCLGTDGVPYFFGGGANRLNAVAPAVVNEWMHLSATWDSQTVRLYVNAQEVAAKVISIDFDGLDLLIGGDKDGRQESAPWHGDLDDIRIYDRALSPQQLADLTIP